MADLISVAEYKAYIGINSNTQDSEIKSIVPKVSQLVKSYCGRTFIDYFDEAKTEVSSGGVNYIYLRETPIQSISSVEYSEDYGKTYTTLTEFTDYVFNQGDDRVECISLQGFLARANAYKITYTGGYEKTPEDLKLACFDLVTYYLKSDMAIKSTRGVGSNNTSVEYITTASMPSHIRRVLDLYREYLI